MKSETIKEFESLRGYMALWVVIGHSLLGFPAYFSNIPIVGYLYAPPIAVSVFVILSGFVIFYLLDSKREPYAVFLIRRAMRLFPAYLFVLFISIISFDSALNLVSTLSDKYPDVASITKVFGIYKLTEAYYLENIVSHLLLLQGLIPNSLVPEGAYAFVIQAWSLSLEWQFYIVAPVCMYFICFKNEFVKFLLPIFLVFLYVLFWDINTAFVFGHHVLYFIVGGGSYYLWKNLISINEGKRVFNLLFLSILFIVLKLSRLELAIMIWFVVYFTALYNYLDCRNGITKFISFFLLNPISRFFGKISYSIYLNHAIVIYGLLRVALSFDQNFLNIGDSMLAVSLFTLSVLILTVLMSAITYRYIEKPFIELGKKWFAKSDSVSTVAEKG